MVYVAHLPWWRRLPWLMLHVLLWHGVARALRLPGGPVQSVPALSRPSRVAPPGATEASAVEPQATVREVREV